MAGIETPRQDHSKNIPSYESWYNNGSGRSLFRLDPKAEIDDTHFGIKLLCPPAYLREIFGTPLDKDGSWIHLDYIFINDHGDVFCLYDERRQYLWLSECSEEDRFWRCQHQYEFGIMGGTNLHDFLEWLTMTINKALEPPPGRIRLFGPDNFVLVMPDDDLPVILPCREVKSRFGFKLRVITAETVLETYWQAAAHKSPCPLGSVDESSQFGATSRLKI